MEINQIFNSSSDDRKNINLGKNNENNEILEGIKLL